MKIRIVHFLLFLILGCLIAEDVHNWVANADALEMEFGSAEEKSKDSDKVEKSDGEKDKEKLDCSIDELSPESSKTNLCVIPDDNAKLTSVSLSTFSPPPELG